MVVAGHSRVGHDGHFLDCWPPTSDGYNFFIQNMFGVFLDSMEIPLSQASSHMLVEGN